MPWFDFLPKKKDLQENVASAKDPMLDLLLSMLDVRLRSLMCQAPDDFIKANLENAREGIDILKKANNENNNAVSWNEAYRIERLLSLSADADIIEINLQRRINELIYNKYSSAERMKIDVDLAIKSAYGGVGGELKLKDSGLKILRDALNNLLEEIHWEDQRKFYVAPILKIAIHRVVILGFLAFFLVIFPYLYLYYRFEEIESSHLIRWVWLPMYTVITVGAFGAFFSRLTEMLRNGDRLSMREVENAARWRNLLLRGSVGMSGALVVFFFLKSGLIEGQLFPKFGEMGLDFISYKVAHLAGSVSPTDATFEIAEPSNALALLAIWSFLAGFSERLVPTILANTEDSFAKGAVIAQPTPNK